MENLPKVGDKVGCTAPLWCGMELVAGRQGAVGIFAGEEGCRTSGKPVNNQERDSPAPTRTVFASCPLNTKA